VAEATVSVLAARNRAEELLKVVGIANPPVDPERVARHLGLRIIVKEFSDVDISGLLMSTGGSAFVCVNRAHPRVRRRFTTAHEIGHYILHHRSDPANSIHVDRGLVVNYRDSASTTGEHANEREANAFAAALLMPSKMLTRAVRRLSGSAPLVDYHVEQLAADFDVSEQAMTIRMQQLGLL
jgi:Zn-dependent peptidase ImmA (M78 family)